MSLEIEQKAPFSCVPVCISCKRKGKCEKTWTTRTGPAKRISSKPRRLPPAAIENINNRNSPYWLMQCGHYTNADIQEMFAHSKPRGKDEFCDQETCWKWYKKLVRKPEAIPDQPPF